MLNMGYKRTSPHYVLFASLMVKSPQKLLGLLSSMLAIAPPQRRTFDLGLWSRRMRRGGVNGGELVSACVKTEQEKRWPKDVEMLRFKADKLRPEIKPK
jgi:hypothetical protein